LKSERSALAICSNGPEDYVEAFLDAYGLRDFFHMVRARGDRFDGKTTMLREILDALGVRPAIAVGDRDDDVRAAHANGAFAIAACYGFGSPEELREADARVSAPSEIPDTVRALIH